MERTNIHYAIGAIIVLAMMASSLRTVSAQWETEPLTTGFLEPNKFSISYDEEPSRLLLAAGISVPIFTSAYNRAGAECLIWSGLRTEGNFQFPVETADYMFGIYIVDQTLIPHRDYKIRYRLSHISSHLVDGAVDTVVGGSSSRFSREFASVEAIYTSPDEGFRFNVSAGLKYIFHQVQKIEPMLQFPITIDCIVADWRDRWNDVNERSSDLRLSLSTAASSQYPSYSSSLIFRYYLTHRSASDVYIQYRTGASNYGIDGESNRSGFEVGVRLMTFAL